jgi:hypothetical protein
MKHFSQNLIKTTRQIFTADYLKLVKKMTRSSIVSECARDNGISVSIYFFNRSRVTSSHGKLHDSIDNIILVVLQRPNGLASRDTGL